MHDSPEIDRESDIKKPHMILDYNSTKGAVDTFDQMLKNYTCARGTRRWPMRLFFFIVDAGLLNGSVIWFLTNPNYHSRDKTKRRSFLLDVSNAMIRPMIEYRARNANISHMPTVKRAMMSVGVEPQSDDACNESVIPKKTWQMPELS